MARSAAPLNLESERARNRFGSRDRRWTDIDPDDVGTSCRQQRGQDTSPASKIEYALAREWLHPTEQCLGMQINAARKGLARIVDVGMW